MSAQVGKDDAWRRAARQVAVLGRARLLGLATLLALVVIGTFVSFGNETRAYATTEQQRQTSAAAAAVAQPNQKLSVVHAISILSPTIYTSPYEAPKTPPVNLTQDSPAEIAARIQAGEGPPTVKDANGNEMQANEPSYDSTLNDCNLLSFCRWHDATNTNAAGLSLTNASASLNTIVSWLAELCFTFCAFILYLLGVVLVLWSSLDVLGKVIFTIDHIFADFGSRVLGMRSDASTSTNVIFGSISLLGVLILALIAMGIWQVVRSRAMTGFHVGHPGFKAIGVGLLVVIGFSVVTNQALKNHPDLRSSGLSKVGQASASTGGEPGSIKNSPPTGVTDNYKNWSPLSPGWLVAVAGNATQLLTSAASEYTLDMANTATDLISVDDDTSECARYEAALDDAFLSTPAYKANGTGASNKNAQVLVQFSHLYEQTYMKMYTYGVLGGSTSAQQAAWCRIAETETGQDTGEQALLSRMAGLYTEALGTGSNGLIPGGNGMVETGFNSKPKNIGTKDGLLVTANGTWNPNDTEGLATKAAGGPGDPFDGLKNAQQYFTYIAALSSGKAIAEVDAGQLLGPDYIATGTAMMYYFAACRWPTPGGAAKLDPAWSQVDDASNAKGDPRPLKTSDCGDPNNVGGFSTYQSQVFNYFEKPQSVGNAIQRGITGSIPLIGGLLQDDKDSHSDLSSFANAAGADQPREYYLLTTGTDTGPVIIMALVCVLISWALLKILGPLILGSLLVQFLAAGTLLVLVFIIFFAALPLKKPRELSGQVIKTVLASMIVGALLALTFGLLFAICNICLAVVLGSISTTSPLLEALLVAGAYLCGMAISRTVLAKLFGSEVLSVRGGLQLPVSMAAAPLTGTGISPLDRGFWQGLGVMEDGKRLGRGLKKAKGLFGRGDTAADENSRKKSEAALVGKNAGADALNKKNGKGLVGAGLMPDGAQGKKASPNGRADDPWTKKGVGPDGKKLPVMPGGLDEKQSKMENLVNNLVPEGKPDLRSLHQPRDVSFAPGVRSGTAGGSGLLRANSEIQRGVTPQVAATERLDPVSKAATVASMLDLESGLFLPDSAVSAIREAAGAGAALGTEAGVQKLSQWVPVGLANPNSIEPYTQIPGASQALVPVQGSDGLVTSAGGSEAAPSPMPPALQQQLTDMSEAATLSMMDPEVVRRGHEVQMQGYYREIEDYIAQRRVDEPNFGHRAEDIREAGWAALNVIAPAPMRGAAWPGEVPDIDTLVNAVEDRLPAARPTRGSSETVRSMLDGILDRASQRLASRWDRIGSTDGD